MNTTTSTQTQNIVNQLNQWENHLPNQIDQIRKLQEDFGRKNKRLSEEGLRLSIGIMGQVKAGKSTFLNALLFNGQSILPEAATPKTANLTRITYGETPCLKIHYYSPEEWQKIESMAHSSSDGDSARVGRDLLKMVAEQHIDVNAVLSKDCEEITTTEVEELMGQLNDFVGENGRYTALVKLTELTLPFEELKGYDVVDTPGMNDPVPSRTQKTREYMAECDVVFFLSRCSQFLDQSDMQLLSTQLPATGIKRMVLIGGQFDGAILDDGYNRASLKATEDNLNKRLGQRAEKEIGKLAKIRQELGQTDAAQLLRDLCPPIFASTFAHSFAQLPQDKWTPSMQHAHEQLLELAEDGWNGYQFSQQDWERLGNFSSLKQAFAQAKKDKQKILQAQQDSLIPHHQEQLRIGLQDLMDAARSRIQQLQKDHDIEKLKEELKLCQNQIKNIDQALKKVIDKFLTGVQKTQTDAEKTVSGDRHDAAQLKTRTGTRYEKSSYTVSDSTWYKPWTWGSERTITETNAIQYNYLLTSDAIEQVVNYGKHNAAHLERVIQEFTDTSKLRYELKVSLLEVLNTGDEDFDPETFRNTLESTLKQLAFPTFKMVLDDTASLIGNSFSGQVKSEKKMDALRQATENAVDLVMKRLLQNLKTAVQQFTQSCTTVRDSLAQQLSESLNSEFKQLAAAYADKEREINVYQNIIDFSKQQMPG